MISKCLENSELPTIYGELPSERIQREIRRGNEIIIKLTQLNYDLGLFSDEEYHQLMGDYCQTHSCGRCLMYQLTCDQWIRESGTPAGEIED